LNSDILAIDIGTTSSKGMAITARGEVVAVRQDYYHIDYPQPGFAEQNAETIFRAVVKLISEILKDCSSRECLGICFSAAMHSLLAVNVNGVAITPIIIWADTRATKQSKRLKEMGVAQELYEKAGTPVHPMSTFCKLLWWKKNQKDIFESAHKFLSIKEYVVFQLTGEYLIDFSTASATGLFDVKELQ
jgi:gluconokinase